MGHQASPIVRQWKYGRVGIGERLRLRRFASYRPYRIALELIFPVSATPLAARPKPGPETRVDQSCASAQGDEQQAVCHPRHRFTTSKHAKNVGDPATRGCRRILLVRDGPGRRQKLQTARKSHAKMPEPIALPEDRNLHTSRLAAPYEVDEFLTQHPPVSQPARPAIRKSAVPRADSDDRRRN